MFWEELGRATLGSPADIMTVTFTAKKYLIIIIHTIDTGGTTNPALQFNNDTGNNYANRNSTDGAADATQVSQDRIFANTGSTAQDTFSHIFVINRAASPKMVTMMTIGEGSSGAGNAPGKRENVAKWQNTSNQISEVDVVNSGSGDFATGSEIIVLGHD